MIKNSLLEDVESELKTLSDLTGVNIKALTAAVVPGSGAAPRNMRSADDHYLKLVVYGLNKEDEVIESSDIQK